MENNEEEKQEVTKNIQLIDQLSISKLSIIEFDYLLNKIIKSLKKVDLVLEDLQDKGRPKVGIYVRVSTEEQKKHGKSIEPMIDTAKNFCEVKELPVYKEYKDEGYTGDNTDRPSFKAMLKDAQEGKVNVFMSPYSSRFARNSSYMNLMEMKLNMSGIIFHTTDEGNDPFLRDVVRSMDKEELRRIRKRVIMTQRGLVVKRLIVNRLPFGFYKKKMKDAKGEDVIVDEKLYVNEKEFGIVKKMFQMFDAGFGLYDIQKKFNFKSTNSVKNLLKNKMYIGIATYKETEYKIDLFVEAKDGVKPFIDFIPKGLFDSVQNK